MSMRNALGIALAAALGACSSATEILTAPKVDYKSAGQLPTLEIPPDLTTPARDNRYVVPDTGKSSLTCCTPISASPLATTSPTGPLSTTMRFFNEIFRRCKSSAK